MSMLMQSNRTMKGALAVQPIIAKHSSCRDWRGLVQVVDRSRLERLLLTDLA